MSSKTASLKLDDKEIVLPIVVGTEGERGVDVRKLRDDTGYITFDDGYANTGACESKVTFIDGEKGILRYRGYGIEELAEKSNFIETAYLLIYGELPTTAQLTAFKARILDNSQIHEGLRIALSGFPGNAHPMAVLSATLNTLGCYYPELGTNERTHDLAKFDETAAVLISKVRTLAALAHRSKEGQPPVYPKPGLDYCSNFLHLLFSQPNVDYAVHPEIARALDLILLLHADHEQNCSTSTVRMVASGGANLFPSVSAGVCALWGPLHGGANQAVIEMLEEIHASGDDGSKFIAAELMQKRSPAGAGPSSNTWPRCVPHLRQRTLSHGAASRSDPEAGWPDCTISSAPYTAQPLQVECSPTCSARVSMTW